MQEEKKLSDQNSARSGKTETLTEVLIRSGYLPQESRQPTQEQILAAVLTRIQRMYVPDHYFLMTEHWDWIVVLQCMQDNNLFKTNPKRPPLHEFVAWLDAHHVPQMLAHYTVRTMSYANKAIDGARYPWTDVEWNRNVIERWKKLYETLNDMLRDATNVIE